MPDCNFVSVKGSNFHSTKPAQDLGAVDKLHHIKMALCSKAVLAESQDTHLFIWEARTPTFIFLFESPWIVLPHSESGCPGFHTQKVGVLAFSQ